MRKVLGLTILAGLMVLFGAAEDGMCAASVPRKLELAGH
jgi:hypothetical protein